MKNPALALLLTASLASLMLPASAFAASKTTDKDALTAARADSRNEGRRRAEEPICACGSRIIPAVFRVARSRAPTGI